MRIHQSRGRRRPRIQHLELRRVLAAAANPLSPVLADLQAQALDLPGEPSAEPADWIYRDPDGRVGVSITARDVPSALVSLTDAGLQEATHSIDHGLIEGLASVGDLTALAEVDGVMSVWPMVRPITRAGLIPSEADPVMESERVRGGLPTTGFDGTGVRIGIMSDSFDALGGAAQDVTDGELPSSPTVDVVADFNGTDEGRAMAQLIHDIAPGATLGYATAFPSETAFATNIAALADPNGFNADIIVDDVFFLTEPFFQDGIVAQAVNDAVDNNGVAYFSSAGNSANNSYERVSPAFTANGLHDFDPGPGVDTRQLFDLGSGTSLFMSIQWDDPFFTNSGVDTDVDVVLYEAGTNNVLAASVADNITGQRPIEIISFTGTGLVELEISVFDGPNPGRLKWINFRGGAVLLEQATNSSTVVGHAAARGLAVGAVPFFDHDTPESFSSHGPTTILFDSSGNALSQPDVRATPEITAVDGISTSFFGQQIDLAGDGTPNFHFFGTSASAPNAAAVGALLLEAEPTFTPDQLYQRLIDTATDVGIPGVDNITGAGLINAWDAIFGPAVAADLTVVGNTATFTEDFESGFLGTPWDTRSNEGGRIRVVDNNASGGTRRLSMDTGSSGFSPVSLNEATLHLNLAGLTNVQLQFDNREFGDEDNPLPANFSGSANGEGASFSVDGTNWFRLISFTGADSTGTYQTQMFDLSTAATNAGVVLGDDTRIRFQQFDNFPETLDGIAIDQIVVTATVPDTVPPEVLAVIAGSGDPTDNNSGWSDAFIDVVDGPGMGNGLGFPLIPSAPPMPWNTVDHLYILFSEDVGSVSPAEILLLGGNISDYSGQIADVQYDATTFIADVQLSSPLGFDKLRLAVNDTVTDAAGNPLDGDFVGGGGGIFDFRFDVVPADATGDGRATIADIGPFTGSFNTQAGQENYNAFADWNSDSRVTTADIAILSANFNANLGGVDEPPPAVFGGTLQSFGFVGSGGENFTGPSSSDDRRGPEDEGRILLF